MISSVFYFLYFAAFGIYVPYWTLYLHHLKLSPVQIATVYAVPSIARIFLPILYGYLADRWRARRSFLIVAAAGQIVPMVLLIQFHSYSWILFCISIFSIFNAVILPFTEATVQEEQEKGRLDYGRTRLWGTFSFILLAISFGKLLDHVEDTWILYGFSFFLVFLSAISFSFPQGHAEFAYKSEQTREVMLQRNTWIFFLCSFLMYLSHGSFYGFYSIYLSQLGVKESAIGLHWAVAAGSEVSIFFFAAWILRSLRKEFLFSLCLLFAALRWFLVYSVTSTGWLLAVQCLHAFTFGAFHITSMKFVHILFPTGSRSLGQSIYSSSTSGYGSVIGVMLSGVLWGAHGARAFLFSSGIAFLAFALSLMFRGEERKDQG